MHDDVSVIRATAHTTLVPCKKQAGLISNSNKMSDNEDDPDIDEGLSILFGGRLSLDSLREAISPDGCWKEEHLDVDEEEPKMNSGSNSVVSNTNYSDYPGNSINGSDNNSAIVDPSTYRDIHNNHEAIYKRAFSLLHTGNNDGFVAPTKPPLKIVVFHDDRGSALIATQPIPKGSIVFTERAMECVQIPSQQDQLNKGEQTPQVTVRYKVKACQQCFRSLELANCLCQISKRRTTTETQCNRAMKINEDDKHNVAELVPQQTVMLPTVVIPYANMWPVPDYPWKIVNTTTAFSSFAAAAENPLSKSPMAAVKSSCNNDNLHHYVQCQQCSSTFCSSRCYQNHLENIGSCCLCQKAIQTLYCNNNINNDLSTVIDEEDAITSATTPQLPLILATKLFCSAIQRHRERRRRNYHQQALLDDEDVILNEICGDSNDLDWLQIGDEITSNSTSSNNGTLTTATNFYSVQRNYDTISKLLDLSLVEREVFDVAYFRRLVAIAARNGFEIRTESPFREYYQSILRSVLGGRNSGNTELHQKIMSQLAKALLVTTTADTKVAQLDKFMDADIADRCSVSALAIFPLLSKINHSCSSNAEVQHGVFKECIVDLVTKRDIKEGEEMTISYIPLDGRCSTARAAAYRRKILYSRYMFWCNCPQCCCYSPLDE